MKLKIGVAAAVAAAVVAGCGGGTTENQAAAGPASILPDNVVAYVWSNNDLDSPAWTKAKALLDRFPGKDEFLRNLRESLEQEGLTWERDIKPALGDESAFAWLDFENGGDNLVLVTQPKNVAKFNALLDQSDEPSVHEEVDDWVVVADTQSVLDRFKAMRDNNGALDDESVFTEAIDGLPEDSIATAFVRGDAVQDRLDRSLTLSGLPSNTTRKQIGELQSVAAAVTPESNGIRIDSAFTGELALGSSTYDAELPSALPEGAILYVSFRGIGSQLSKSLDQLRDLSPNFDQQRAQIETVLGFSLEELFDLLSGEGAIALYPAALGGTPEFLAAVRVSDEEKARRLIGRLATLAAASGTASKPLQIGSVTAREFQSSVGSIFAAVVNGTIVVTNADRPIRAMVDGGTTLADDPLYEAAVSTSRMPSETTGFVYANLRDGVDYVFGYVEREGETVPRVAKDNVRPLRGLLLYGAKDGDRFIYSGFLGIE